MGNVVFRSFAEMKTRIFVFLLLAACAKCYAQDPGATRPEFVFQYYRTYEAAPAAEKYAPRPFAPSFEPIFGDVRPADQASSARLRRIEDSLRRVERELKFVRMDQKH